MCLKMQMVMRGCILQPPFNGETAFETTSTVLQTKHLDSHLYSQKISLLLPLMGRNVLNLFQATFKILKALARQNQIKCYITNLRAISSIFKSYGTV